MRDSDSSLLPVIDPAPKQTTLDLAYGYRHDGDREINQVVEDRTGVRKRRLDVLAEIREQYEALKNERETIKSQLALCTRDKELCQKQAGGAH